MADHKTAKESMESPDSCPFCHYEDADIDNDDNGYCPECKGEWKVERRYVGYSYVDDEYHECIEEPGGRISSLEEQVRILREALAAIDKHPTNGNSEPDSMAEALEQIHALAAAALEATKEGA
jgi:hypothetical protein